MTTPDKPSRWRALWILPPLMIGALVLMWSVSHKQPPAKIERGEPTRVVRVIEVPQLDLTPTAEGYGPVEPARVWSAVTQVAGRVVEIHPQLRDGEIIPEGALLVRIDPVDYELAMAQAKAELTALAVQEKNAKASLAIEARNLSLSEKELQRKRKLVKQGTASQRQADEAERAMLGSRTAIQNLKNTLALIPTQRQVLQAQSDRVERDLAHTVIRAPFNMRVANMNFEMDQSVANGQTLFEGDAVDRVEIKAQVSLSSLRRLFIGHPDIKVGVTQLAAKLPQMAGFKPLVRLDMGEHVAQWEAEFIRFSDDVDPQTRTMGVVVAVDKPFDKIKPGYRPPLTKGMFVQVVLRGRVQAQRLVVPRSTVRGGALHVVDGEERLRRRPVTVLFNQGSLSVIDDGLQPGERVVVSDLVPAVEGMLLQPQVDLELTAQMLSAAGGAL
ncbi:MAG: efflux RND transporter periplasmic adaptor subunit [Magnetococcales bacterium]|nr:efflux RND transporter periplasmic adaptor subunit [Magnetococcales bacterium]